jgi:hypothetical protein
MWTVSQERIAVDYWGLEYPKVSFRLMTSPEYRCSTVDLFLLTSAVPARHR